MMALTSISVFLLLFFCITFECCIKRQKHAPPNIQKRWHRLIHQRADIRQIFLIKSFFFLFVWFLQWYVYILGVHLNEIISSKFDGTWYLCYFCTSLAIGLDFCLEIWVRKKIVLMMCEAKKRKENTQITNNTYTYK